MSRKLSNGMPARGNARDVWCRVCGAPGGTMCREARPRIGLPLPAYRKTYHPERWEDWRKVEEDRRSHARS